MSKYRVIELMVILNKVLHRNTDDILEYVTKTIPVDGHFVHCCKKY